MKTPSEDKTIKSTFNGNQEELGGCPFNILRSIIVLKNNLEPKTILPSNLIEQYD